VSFNLPSLENGGKKFSSYAIIYIRTSVMKFHLKIKVTGRKLRRYQMSRMPMKIQISILAKEKFPKRRMMKSQSIVDYEKKK